MTELELIGCTPTPLSNYLKGLGLLRLLSHRDLGVRAAWRSEHLVLRTTLDREAVRTYLLDEYAPTPILAPWNGGSGFYFRERKSKEKDPATGKRIKLGVRDEETSATKVVEAIADSETQRLDSYRGAIRVCRRQVNARGLIKAPEGDEKERLILSLRGVLPDAAVEWLDATVFITSDSAQLKAKYPPLLGTGGVDGNFDMSSNFMQRLLDVLDPESGCATPLSATWLDMALFGELAPAQAKNAIGQFSPGQVGGPNSTIGFEGSAGMNPWDFVLMLEGALAFAAATVRRNAQDGEGALSYPFTVRATAAGICALGAHDAKEGKDGMTRGELWMPLWSRNASYPEVRSLLSEGRVALGRRPVRDALDFVRAVHRLGGYRGVDRFQRYSLLRRNGKAFLATPLQRVQVTPNPQSEWIDELEQGDWLARFRRFSQGNKVARRFILLRKRLDDALFGFAGAAAGPAQVQVLLSLLGEIQYVLAGSTKARKEFGPVPLLSARWALSADDGSPAYRIARALASLRGKEGKPLPLRAQLFPVHPRRHDWIEAACKAKGAAKDPVCGLRLTVPRAGRLADTLIALLERRLWLAERLEFHDKPFHAGVGIGLDDLNAFLRDARMDRAIVALLPGLALVKDIPGLDQRAGGAATPAAFGLLKLVLTPDAWLRSFTGLPADRSVPVPPGLVARLASGHPGQARHAVETAWRRLQGSGFVPLMPRAQCPELAGTDPRRLAAALLIPLSYGATGVLAQLLLAQPKSRPQGGVRCVCLPTVQ
jgi:CRISPR-associated protein Csx17